MDQDNLENEEATTNDESIENMEENQEGVQNEAGEHLGETEWEPNFKYSVRDKEYEFDETIRGAITSPEVEQHIRDLYTRSQGLEGIKSNYEQAQTRLQELEELSQRYQSEAEYNKQGIEGIKELAKTDFNAFAHMVGLDDQTILTYANRRLDYKEKPEYERRMIDEDMERRTQSYQNNLELEKLRSTNDKLLRDRHQATFNQAMAVPEIQTFEKVFDERMGKGAFVNHIKNYGSTQTQLTKQYVAPQIAVQAVYAQFKPLFEDKLSEINKTETASIKQPKPPTNLGEGKTGTPVKRKVKSLADLNRIANELAKRTG
jgi:hypothetical protein